MDNPHAAVESNRPAENSKRAALIYGVSVVGYCLGTAGVDALETLENTAIQSMPQRGTAEGTANVPAKPCALTQRQETFARLYVETGVAVEAYQAAYTSNSSRAVARVDAYRLLRNPKVTARVRELQDAAAARSVRSTAALIADLEAMVDADPNELCSLTVGACRHCHGEGGAYQWRDEREHAQAVDRWLASLSTPVRLPPPADGSGGYGYIASREPNPECGECNGQGVARVLFNSTADASPGARRLLRGIELFPDGSVKRVLLHDQTQLRIELHKLRGLHVDRSVSLTATVNVPALPKNMTVEDALRMLETIAPAPATDAPDSNVVSEQ